MIEAGSVYFVADGAGVHLYERFDCWEIWYQIRFGLPNSPLKVFQSAEEATEFVFSFLSKGEQTD